MEHKLPDLPYPYNALEPYIDTRTMEIHHSKHHQAYVTNLNAGLKKYPKLLKFDVDYLITNILKLPTDIRSLVRNNGGGHSNHSFFWDVMTPAKKSGKPQAKLLKEIEGSFGSFNLFKDKFTAAALGRFGSGWAWLTLENGNLTIEDTQNQDSPISKGRVPILGLDVWEHAYYLKYQNKRADYISAWWNVVNWAEVEKNLSKALK
ncbi:MAG: Superoxide dismutase [Candidatus Woesebacteria bacterium GW2011_GWB1_39_12]|uniref:Superoxide dismutase n=2 Tax=Candidatus Woeseibacteriota TaxID=1752722 RepID=A0A0G0M8N8_9BACT|nr:MAG: Superoxide dismutase [Candidatus Woesebacteria bacterium GW2011_GWB1_39_12]